MVFNNFFDVFKKKNYQKNGTQPSNLKYANY